MDNLLQHRLKAFAFPGILAITLVAFAPGHRTAIHNIRPPHNKSRSPYKPPDLPHMWTDDNSSKTDEKYFRDFYIPKLVKLTGHKETDSIFYSIKAFRGMINYCTTTLTGVKWLDIYPAVSPGVFPAGDTLTLLFVPKDSKFKPLKYLKMTANAATFPQADDIVDPTTAQTWIGNYTTRIANLKTELDPNDPANYLHCIRTAPNFSNTVYLHHPWSDFSELEGEFDIQLKQYGKQISGIKAFFAARPDQTGTKYTLSKRLYAILEFTIEDNTAYPHRIYAIGTKDRYWPGASLPPLGTCKPPAAAHAAHLAKPAISGNNNGQMCPPTCNP